MNIMYTNNMTVLRNNIKIFLDFLFFIFFKIYLSYSVNHRGNTHFNTIKSWQ